MALRPKRKPGPCVFSEVHAPGPGPIRSPSAISSLLRSGPLGSQRKNSHCACFCTLGCPTTSSTVVATSVALDVALLSVLAFAELNDVFKSLSLSFASVLAALDEDADEDEDGLAPGPASVLTSAFFSVVAGCPGLADEVGVAGLAEEVV